MNVFLTGLKFGSTAALDCRNGQNKDRYCEKELLLLICTCLVGFIDRIMNHSQSK